MRDPARIAIICNKLQEAWKEQPDMRFTQLLDVIGINESKTVNDDYGFICGVTIKDNFNVEDDQIEAKIDRWTTSVKKGGCPDCEAPRKD